MARYEYACESCGSFELARAIGTAAPVEACPVCGRDSARVFTAPALVSSRRAPLSRAREAADRSAHEPVVTAAPPPLPRGRPRPPNPLQARLPRP